MVDVGTGFELVQQVVSLLDVFAQGRHLSLVVVPGRLGARWRRTEIFHGDRDVRDDAAQQRDLLEEGIVRLGDGIEPGLLCGAQRLVGWARVAADGAEDDGREEDEVHSVHAHPSAGPPKTRQQK